MVIESKISIRKSHISYLQLSYFARIVYFTKSFISYVLGVQENY